MFNTEKNQANPALWSSFDDLRICLRQKHAEAIKAGFGEEEAIVYCAAFLAVNMSRMQGSSVMYGVTRKLLG